MADGGLGFGALVALMIVVLYQLKVMQKMSQSIDQQGKALEGNTLATREMTEMLRSFRETDREMVRAVESCKASQRIPQI